MLMRRLLILAAALLPAAPALAEPAWRDQPALPMAVFHAAGCVTGDRLVLVGGLNGLTAPMTIVQSYDLTHKRWSTPMRLKTPRYQHVAAALPGNRVLVAGGVSKRDTPNLTSEIVNLAAGKVEPGPPMPEPAQDPTLHTLSDGRLLVVGDRSAHLFDPQAMAWNGRIRLHAHRLSHASVMLDDNRVLVAGGLGRRDLELLNIRKNSSTLLDVELPTTLDDLQMAPVDANTAWVLGGQDGNLGDTTSKTWFVTLLDEAGRAEMTPGPDLPVAAGVADACVVEIDNRYSVMIGGESQQDGRDTELADAWLLDRQQRTVTALPATRQAHDDAVALRLPGRPARIVVIGGLQTIDGPFGVVSLPSASAGVEVIELARPPAQDEPTAAGR